MDTFVGICGRTNRLAPRDSPPTAYFVGLTAYFVGLTAYRLPGETHRLHVMPINPTAYTCRLPTTAQNYFILFYTK